MSNIYVTLQGKDFCYFIWQYADCGVDEQGGAIEHNNFWVGVVLCMLLDE